MANIAVAAWNSSGYIYSAGNPPIAIAKLDACEART